MAARAAVEKLDHVNAVETDMRAHTVTVTFDEDEQELDTIVDALGRVGYAVTGWRQRGN